MLDPVLKYPKLPYIGHTRDHHNIEESVSVVNLKIDGTGKWYSPRSGMNLFFFSIEHTIIAESDIVQKVLDACGPLLCL